MLHIKLRGKRIKSPHCESGPSYYRPTNSNYVCDGGLKKNALSSQNVGPCML